MIVPEGAAYRVQRDFRLAATMVDPELDALKREFLTEAQEKIREIESALSQDGGLDRVAYIAHQLKGSGGSYGYSRISSEAAEIERAVEDGDGNAGELIRDHVSKLREEIDRRSRELSTSSAST
jgi:HPt (histidine-containing phosphotransfer) domain-containing protein